MKNTKLLRVLLLLLVVVAALCTVACNMGGGSTTTETPTTTPLKDPVTLTIKLSATEIEGAGAVQATATVKGTDNTAVTWSVSNPVVAITDAGVITIANVPTYSRLVKVTATSVADPTVSASASLIVKAPFVDGQVGDLTSDMLAEMGNLSITASGTLSDVYRDLKNAVNSNTNTYEFTVKMMDGAWMGSWNVQGSDTVISDQYRRGTAEATGANGAFGHVHTRVYVDRHNTVKQDVVKDYMSIPSIWESQHLWNHIGELNIERFVYDPDNDVYSYVPKADSEADQYLMAYFSYCFTPMLSDTLSALYLKVKDGKIVSLSAQTEVLLYGDDTQKDPEAMTYTTFELTFSDVGTTVVEDPTPYEAPSYADKLTAALAEMAAAKNYTYRTKDTQTYAVQGDSGDYDLNSVSGNTRRGRAYGDALLGFSYKNNVTQSGIVGEVGYVTPDAIVKAKTGKYTASLDDKLYHTEYYGVKQNANGTYDEFEYQSSVGAFVGTRNLKGNIFDKMPKFDMSANIFEYTAVRTEKGVNQYTFTLRDSAIVREVAQQLALYNANSAAASVANELQIVVDDNGHLVSCTFPYSISDIYIGYCTTTFSNVGTTVLEEDAFTDYVPRVIRTNWNQYTLTDFYYKFSGSCKDYGCAGDHTPGKYDHSFWTANADVVLKSIYGDSWTSVPTPDVLMGLFGDYLNGPFYNWRSVGTDADGKDINHGYMSITTSSTEYDENGKITNYEELAGQIKSVMESQGFTLSVANSDTTGGETGRSNRYLTFIKGDVQIVFENNGTKYFWIYFYQTGDWTLKK